MFTATRVFTRGANFSTVGRIFTLRAQVYTVLTEVWHCANRAMVTNNKTVLTEVRANRNSVNRGFPVQQNICYIFSDGI